MRLFRPGEFPGGVADASRIRASAICSCSPIRDGSSSTTVPRSLYTLGEHGYAPDDAGDDGHLPRGRPDFRSGRATGGAGESNAARAAHSPAAASESDSGDTCRTSACADTQRRHPERATRCHPERSEGSAVDSRNLQIPRVARDDDPARSTPNVRNRRPPSRASQVFAARCVPQGAHVSDGSIYAAATKNPEAFWEAQAKELEWYKTWDKVLDWKPPHSTVVPRRKAQRLGELRRPAHRVGATQQGRA